MFFLILFFFKKALVTGIRFGQCLRINKMYTQLKLNEYYLCYKDYSTIDSKKSLSESETFDSYVLKMIRAWVSKPLYLFSTI